MTITHNLLGRYVSPILGGDLVVCQTWLTNNYANIFSFRYLV